ncbi:Fungal Zn(2)-Cys(6) binuclear cluster domain family protein [Candida albicans]|uniref:Fungal Zn(2)-Cys(6) binuclear cluster domain family protein n=1 Tax=Candida albicans TaxID=5476 RepID=A0A8H6F3W5_CANAX|nr:Fungal Zn(2)-Cys(6) binuclear cluster domain family protein [Candida albicans]
MSIVEPEVAESTGGDAPQTSVKSPEPSYQQSSQAQGKYKRNYRACLNCRLRKVKCDLGPVDNPHDGKCARCLRERKDCVFVESKRGGTTNVVNGKRKRQRASSRAMSRSETQSPDSNNVSSTTSTIASQNDNTNVPLINMSINNIMQKLPGVESILPKDNTKNPPHSAFSNPSTSSPSSSLSSMPMGQPPQLPPISNKPSIQNQSLSANSKSLSNEFATMESALVFLANAAGEIAKADERDNIDAQSKYDQIEASLSGANSHRVSIDESMNHQQQQEQSHPHYQQKSQQNHHHHKPPQQELHHSQPLNIPNNAPEGFTNNHRIQTEQSNIPPYIKPTTSRRMFVPPAESGNAVRPKGSNKLSSIDYIGPAPRGILTEDEAKRLINLFFATMHPYFPHIPKFLHSPKVLSNYPILLCAILTISSRHIEVHDRLWLYVQRLISQTFGQRQAEEINDTDQQQQQPQPHQQQTQTNSNTNSSTALSSAAAAAATASTAATTASVFGQPNDENNSGLAGLGAMRRSHRMAWMLIGSAVRLAQDMGFMEISSKAFLATHIAEINAVMNMSRRSMLANSLSEVDLDEDEITVEDMEQAEEKDDDSKIMQMNEEELKKISTHHVLKFTKSQKATIELLQIMSLGHESLYGYKAQLGQLTHRQTLSVLNILSPLINNWGRKYKEFLVPSSTTTNNKLVKLAPNLPQHWLDPESKICREIADTIERETFIIEFNYVKLYIYSLALNQSPKSMLEKGTKIKLDELSKSAKYIEQAFHAANETLNAAHRIHRFKMLRFMPVRLLTRFIRAAAFIVRCHLTMTAQENISLSVSKITIDEIIKSTHRAAMTLRECSPDELHLLSRYSTILMVLYSEMKSKRNRKEEVDDENNESAVVTETVMQDNSSGNASEPKQVPGGSTVNASGTHFLSASSGASNNGIPGMGQSTATQQSQPSHTPVGLTPGTYNNSHNNSGPAAINTGQMEMNENSSFPSVPPPVEDFDFDFNIDELLGDGFQNIVDLWSFLN